MKQKFTQFSVGELEAGARKRQGLAEARRHAQVRDSINLEVFATSDLFLKLTTPKVVLVLPLRPSSVLLCDTVETKCWGSP